MNDVFSVEDLFAGCTIEDIALAVGYGEPGSEDQAFALDALRRRLPAGAGHNQPPLSEMLDEDLEPFWRRRDALVETAKTAVILDQDTAAKVLDLSQMCRALEDEIEARRKALIKPHREAEKIISNKHGRLRLDVQVVRQGMTGSGGLRGMLTDWDDKQAAKAAAAKAKAETEAQEREAEAEIAQAKLAGAGPGGRGAVSAELAAMAAQDQAERARDKAEAIQPAPIRGHLGQVNRKRAIRFNITDWVGFAAWLDSRPGLQNALRTALSAICGQHLRSLGVDAVATGIAIPGVAVSVVQGDAFIRR